MELTRDTSNNFQDGYVHRYNPSLVQANNEKPNHAHQQQGTKVAEY